MKSEGINITTKKINIILNLLLSILEFGMLISILMFLYFIVNGYVNLGHIPFYGDRELIAYNGLDRILVIVMIYPMCLGYLLWLFFILCGFLSGIERKPINIIIGLGLCILNLLAMFSSQFAWILD